jgi:ElaB/YqjD/DUF883 family membrane-anchored ribosome-binding protein
MATITNDTIGKTNSIANDYKSKMQSADDQLGKMSYHVGERVGAMATNLANTTSEYVKSSRDYIHDNPGKSVAIAATAGIVAGSLMTMVMHRR